MVVGLRACWHYTATWRTDGQP